MSLRTSSCCVLALLAIGFAGCRSSELLGKVSGRVTVQGKPVDKAIVVFGNDETGVHVTAAVDADGRYAVEMAKGHGLPPGTYQVSIVPPPIAPPAFSTGPVAVPVNLPERPDIPTKYRNAKTSGMTLTVVPDGKSFDIDMQP